MSNKGKIKDRRGDDSLLLQDKLSDEVLDRLKANLSFEDIKHKYGNLKSDLYNVIVDENTSISILSDLVDSIKSKAKTVEELLDVAEVFGWFIEEKRGLDIPKEKRKVVEEFLKYVDQKMYQELAEILQQKESGGSRKKKKRKTLKKKKF